MFRSYNGSSIWWCQDELKTEIISLKWPIKMLNRYWKWTRKVELINHSRHSGLTDAVSSCQNYFPISASLSHFLVNMGYNENFGITLLGTSEKLFWKWESWAGRLAITSQRLLSFPFQDYLSEHVTWALVMKILKMPPPATATATSQGRMSTDCRSVVLQGSSRTGIVVKSRGCNVLHMYLFI